MDLNEFLLRELGTVTTETGLAVEDNILNKYSRYAYHFRLVMVGESDSRDLNIAQRLGVSTAVSFRNPLNPAPTDPVKQITLAESGVTVGLNLVTVEIQDSVSPNHRFKNTTTVEINMTITEPYGMQLVDKMFAASKTLGVKNYRLAPLFLELTFKCYDQEGNLISGAAENIRKVWKIILVDFNATLTEVGSTYTVKAATSNTQAFTDYYYLIPHSRRISTGGGAAAIPPATPAPATPRAAPPLDYLRITQTGSVGAFFEQLGTQLTEFYALQRGANAPDPILPLLIYKFTICPTLGNIPIPSGPNVSQRRASFARADAGSNDILVSRGISITSLLDDVLASIPVPDEDPRTAWWSTPPTGPATTGGRVLLPKVEVIVTNVGWDGAMNDYVREFHFVVSVTESTRPVPTRQWGRTYQGSTPAQIQEQRDRLTQLNASKTLRKAYPYYYTGLNTEIIHLDLTFQNLHIIPLPLADTLPLPAQEAAAISIVETQIRRNASDQQALDQEITEARGILSFFRRQELQTRRNQLQTERQTLEQELTRLRSETARRGLAFFDDIYLRSLEARIGNIAIDQDVQQQIREQLERSAQRNANEVALRSFVEDETSLFSNDPGEFTYAADIRDVANRMSRTTVNSDPGERGRQLYGSILSQIYDKPAMHLTEIEMNIKGDPYWLGKTNLERTIELETLINSTPEGLNTNRFGSRTDNYANYYDYDAHFIMLFRAGQPPDPDTGFQNLDLVRNAEGAVTGSVYFAAVYQTIEVMHVFQNGQFTQKIKAIRDGLINLQGLRSIGTPATPEEPPAPAAPSLVPGAVLSAAPAEPGSLIRNRGESTADFNRRVREAALATAQINQQNGLRTPPTQPTPPMAPNE